MSLFILLSSKKTKNVTDSLTFIQSKPNIMFIPAFAFFSSYDDKRVFCAHDQDKSWRRLNFIKKQTKQKSILFNTFKLNTFLNAFVKNKYKIFICVLDNSRTGGFRF